MTELDTGTADLLASIDDGVALVTLNRPERRNALSGPMLGALASVLERLEVDDTVGCVVVTGAGGGFCAGGDVKGMAGDGDSGGQDGPGVSYARDRAPPAAHAAPHRRPPL